MTNQFYYHTILSNPNNTNSWMLLFLLLDLSKAIDSSIKDKINDLTGNDDYEFGDLRYDENWIFGYLDIYCLIVSI